MGDLFAWFYVKLFILILGIGGSFVIYKTGTKGNITTPQSKKAFDSKLIYNNHQGRKVNMLNLITGYIFERFFYNL